MPNSSYIFQQTKCHSLEAFILLCFFLNMELSWNNNLLKQHKHLTIVKTKENQNQKALLSTTRILKNLKTTKLEVDSYGSFNNCHFTVILNQYPRTMRSVVELQNALETTALKVKQPCLSSQLYCATGDPWWHGTNHAPDPVRTKCSQPGSSLTCDSVLGSYHFSPFLWAFNSL